MLARALQMSRLSFENVCVFSGVYTETTAGNIHSSVRNAIWTRVHMSFLNDNDLYSIDMNSQDTLYVEGHKIHKIMSVRHVNGIRKQLLKNLHVR
jgi:hypothetical protein